MFTYENVNTTTYLVYKMNDKDEIDNTSFGMMTHNKIEGIISIFFTQMNEDRYFKYNISSKTTLKDFFEAGMNKRKIICVFSGILNAFIQAEEYMIDSKCLLLDLERIYVDVSTFKTEMICLPLYVQDSKTPDFLNFFRNLVFNAKFDQSEDCDYIAKLINYLNSTTVFSLVEFKKMLDGLQENKNEVQVKNHSVEKEVRGTNVSSEKQADIKNTSEKEIAKPVVSQSQQKESIPPVPKKSIVSGNQVKAGVQQRVPTQGNPFPIPQGKPVKSESNEIDNADEEEISMMYLLQHYNKENKEKYMAQKKKKKEKKNQVASPLQENIPVPPQGGATGQTLSVKTAASPVTGNTPSTPKSEPQMANFQSANQDFGNTTVLNLSSPYAETTVLSATAMVEQPKPYLIRMKNNEKIMINKPTFRIGKEKSFVDYFIGDNSAISRNHATIITREDTCYLIDVNSTNHTYLNGAMLSSNAEYVIEDGNKIRFANEEYEFRSGK